MKSNLKKSNYRLILILTVAIITLTISGCSTSLLEGPNNLTVAEGFENPIGLYDQAPTFSWKLPVSKNIKSQPGYKKVRIAPVPGDQLDFAAASYNSIYGEVSSAWKKVGNFLKKNKLNRLNLQSRFRSEFYNIYIEINHKVPKKKLKGKLMQIYNKYLNNMLERKFEIQTKKDKFIQKIIKNEIL